MISLDQEHVARVVATNKDLKIGTIVQLDAEKTENKMFASTLMVVTEIKPWGVQGYVQALGSNGQMGGQAHYRAEFGTFHLTGGTAVPSGFINDTKHCRQCRAIKPKSEFNTHGITRDGLRHNCKACRATYERESRRRNKIRLVKFDEDRKRALKKEHYD